MSGLGPSLSVQDPNCQIIFTDGIFHHFTMTQYCKLSCESEMPRHEVSGQGAMFCNVLKMGKNNLPIHNSTYLLLMPQPHH